MRRNGFTILEIMVVLGIVFLLFVIVMESGHPNPNLMVPRQVSPTRWDFHVPAFADDNFSASLAEFERLHPELRVIQTTPSDFDSASRRPTTYIVSVEANQKPSRTPVEQ